MRRIAIIGVVNSVGEKIWQKALGRAGLMDVLLPLAKDRDHITALIEDEFAHGMVTEAARADVVRIAHSLRQAGARALLVVAPQLAAVLEDAVPVLPIFDATELHAIAVVDWMTANSSPVHRVA